MEKRYAIVRVDDNCPSKYEKGFNDYFVCDGRGKDMRLCVDKINCNKCNYGDTKEQLARKITTAQKRAIAKHRSEVMTYEKMAKEIVEFLGVEE